ncbi:MAG: glutamate mutase L [Armatimonadetes bacterium]|nr:glutamate mutase L [Armatimonadota bacterium]
MGTSKLDVIIATDCGSTTTKAILIERQGGEYRLVVRGEAPTTVEAPFEDVTIGVRNAFFEVEELSGRRLLEDGELVKPAANGRGVDGYFSTSSAGGGLQIVVVGLVRRMTAESAQRAALGAGAIVMDVIALDDGRAPHQRIEQMRSLRPDMILLSGGIDGGEVRRVVMMAELIAAANPQARLGTRFRLPVIFAGNRDCREEIQRVLGEKFDLTIVENLRPTMETENLGPTRQAIQDLFLEHVMAQAPGYGKLLPITDAEIMPTPAAVGNMMQVVAHHEGLNLLGVDIGGATTDVFSVFDGVFNRTVSANLGMSYSVSQVLAEAGLDKIARWLPAGVGVAERALSNRIRNKMIRPTTVPQTLDSLIVEQAVAREALRLALDQHKELATGLKGVRQRRDIADAFRQRVAGETLVDMMRLDLIIGSGGVLSHAPRRVQAAMMMVDAFQPEGVTRLAVDSIFMMPHLGVLATVCEEAAMQVFWRDCLVPLGTCIAARGRGKPGEPCMTVSLDAPGGLQTYQLAFGDLVRMPLPTGEKAVATVEPARGFDCGAGPGRRLVAEVTGGQVGLLLDARGRPLLLPDDVEERRQVLARWAVATDLYPAFPSSEAR